MSVATTIDPVSQTNFVLHAHNLGLRTTQHNTSNVSIGWPWPTADDSRQSKASCATWSHQGSVRTAHVASGF